MIIIILVNTHENMHTHIRTGYLLLELTRYPSAGYVAQPTHELNAATELATAHILASWLLQSWLPLPATQLTVFQTPSKVGVGTMRTDIPTLVTQVAQRRRPPKSPGRMPVKPGPWRWPSTQNLRVPTSMFSSMLSTWPPSIFPTPTFSLDPTEP